MKVFVTGGTGFIGGAVVRQLRARGDDVVALVRNPAKGAPLEALGCTLVAGDLSDERAIRAGMEGCDAVIHGAAIYEVGIPASERKPMQEANVGGTERVLGAALRGGRSPRSSTSPPSASSATPTGRSSTRATNTRPTIPLRVREDEVGSPPGRQAADRRGAPLRDRPAGRRLRPRRRPRRSASARPVPRREDAADPLPDLGICLDPRRGHRRRDHPGTRQRHGPARPTSSAAR